MAWRRLDYRRMYTSLGLNELISSVITEKQEAWLTEVYVTHTQVRIVKD